MGIMQFGSMRRTLLATSVSLMVGGFLSLMMLTNNSAVPRSHFVSPTTYGTTLPSTFDPILGTSTTLSRRHGSRTTVGGEFIDVSRSLPPGTTTTGPQSDPTQVDVGVPAAGAQVSVGQGPGSCTDVAITALTPDDCPPPPGSGPVNVDPGPTSGNLIPGIGPKSGYAFA
jgi:hypothetical protein